MNKLMRRRTLLCLLALTQLTACGLKGPLVLPKQSAPTAASAAVNTSATQDASTTQP